MLRKKGMPDQTENLIPKNRHCSVCKQSGHSKLACPHLEAKADRKLGHIPVHISAQPITSPHIVAIGKNPRPIQEIPVFAEKPSIVPHRQVVSWEDLIKQEEPNVSEENCVDETISASEDFEFHQVKPAKQVTLKIQGKNPKPKVDLSLKLRRQRHEMIDGYREWRSRVSPRQFTFSVALLAAILLIPFPTFSYYQKLRTDTNVLVENSVNAFLSLQSSTAAVLNTNLPQAQYDLNAALASFSQAEAIIEREHKALVYVASLLPVVGDKVTSRSHILNAGHEVAIGNAYLVKGISEASASSSVDLVDRLATFKVHLRGAIPKYETALAELAQVKPEALPVEYQNSFSDFRLLFTALLGDLKNMNSVLSGIETMLGSDQPKRYLVLFQNHHELRPTGGFIGSVAIVDVQRGKITKMEVPPGGSYDFQGQLDTFVKPPLPLQIANARWELQDSNWYPDFPASAEKAAWFYEHSRHATIDGVIAVNATVLERLLKAFGPIKNDQYNLILTAESGLETLQTVVEYGPDKADNKPKAVIGAIVDQLFNSKIKPEPSQMVPMVTEIASALAQKEIQIYSTDAKVQEKFSALGWTGEIAATAINQDYLMVVNTNLGGAKTDARITDKVEHQTVVQADGTVLDTVIIRRKHNGEADESLYGRPNSSYIRVYVPRGAELIKAGGFIYPEEERFKVPEKWYKIDSDLTSREIERGFHVESGTRLTEEFGKTVFGNWITTKAGEETEVWLTYKLPFKLGTDTNIDAKTASTVYKLMGKTVPASRYTLLIQKQSGTNTEFSTQIIYPDTHTPIWRSREDYELGTNGARWEGTLKNDELFGVVVKQTN